MWVGLALTIEGDLARAESVAVPITWRCCSSSSARSWQRCCQSPSAPSPCSARSWSFWLVTSVADVSVFSISLVTALGLGLAIDYSLFVVSRFREELAAGRDVVST